LLDYLKTNYSRINIPKVIHYCQMNSQWPELVFLYVHYDEFDNATLTMLAHPADAWEHVLFKDVIVKVANTDIYYKGVQFYLNEHPAIVNDLLAALASRIDHTRVVGLVRKMNLLALVKPYLQSVQDKNVIAVNEALNELYVEEEDFESLRNSIDHFDAFDPIQLATNLEKHNLLEFKRIAALLYRRNARWAQSVELSKTDKLYKDAIETAAESKKQDVAEGLLDFFVKQSLKECFAACLYTCYDVISPDVALELAWKNKILDFAFPFLIQVFREYVGKVDTLYKEFEKKKKDEERKNDQPNAFAQVHDDGYMQHLPQLTYYPTDQMQMAQQMQNSFGGGSYQGNVMMNNMGAPGMPGMMPPFRGYREKKERKKEK